ncbi:MAG: hypothetical protein OK457_07635 [Thaumarchaeota archaeon]|nr:hypothetical protein [Nitrososphaerota archaeon]
MELDGKLVEEVVLVEFVPKEVAAYAATTIITIITTTIAIQAVLAIALLKLEFKAKLWANHRGLFILDL